MSEIRITRKSETDAGWRFYVGVFDGESSRDFVVDVGREYLERIAAGALDPHTLVRRSFEFLLEREPKESILREFDVKVISSYFPEYEDEVRKWTGSK